MQQHISSLHHQRGASVTTIVLMLVALGILIKMGLAIIPAYVGDYQLTQLIAQELKKANEEKLTDAQFIKALDQQFSINANYKTKAEDVLTFTNKTPGTLAVKTKYEVENQFYKETFIVNRFEKEITGAEAK